MNRLILKLIVFTFLVLISVKIYAQDSLLVKISEYKKEREDILTNKKIYKYGDLLVKNHRVGIIGPDAYRIADSLDRLHPRYYFNKARVLIKQNRLNDASFIYYLGCLRYRYYNSSNPYFTTAEDGALFTVLETSVGGPINMYLKTNFENFTEILKKSQDWFTGHDYNYFPKSNNTMKFMIVANGLDRLITDLEKDKTRYTMEWKVQRKLDEQDDDKKLKEIDSELRNSARE